MPFVPKNSGHHSGYPKITSFDGTAPDQWGSNLQVLPIASNRLSLIILPSLRFHSVSTVWLPEGPTNRSLTSCNRPTIQLPTRRNSTSASFLPAVNDRPAEWRTCRPDQTIRFVEPASKSIRILPKHHTYEFQNRSPVAFIRFSWSWNIVVRLASNTPAPDPDPS